MANGDYPKREERHGCDTAATVWRQSGAAIHGRLVNISSSGCRVRHRKTLWMGERVILDVPGSPPKPAIVRWSLLGNAGLKFCDWREQS